VSKRSRRARPANQQGTQPAARPVNQPAPNAGAAPASSASASSASAASASAVAKPSPSQRPPTARPSSARAGRRERARPYAQQKSFFERFRVPIVAVVGVAALALITVWAFNSASAAAFSCSTEWVPDPTASPAPGSSPQPGYHQESMGNSHVGAGTSSSGDVTYTYCPPASGNHFVRGGPITPGAYGPGDVPLPQGWIHNLEHGGLVVLYRGNAGDPGPTSEVQQQMQAFFSSLPPSPVCNFAPTQEGAGVTIARFDQMATPFTALVWERALPLETFDEDAIMDLWTTYGERTNPEKLCAPPSAAPSGPASPAAN
jgi:hypothetical protein